MFYNKKIYSVLDEIFARRKTVNIYILKFKESWGVFHSPISCALVTPLSEAKSKIEH